MEKEVIEALKKKKKIVNTKIDVRKSGKVYVMTIPKIYIDDNIIIPKKEYGVLIYED